MPRYDYRCSSCREIVEVSMSMSDAGTVWVGHDHLVWSPVLSHKPMRDCFPLTRFYTPPMLDRDGTHSYDA